MSPFTIAVVAALAAALVVVSLSAAAPTSGCTRSSTVPAPDRLALADRDRGSVRARRRQAGRRRRPGLELPGARAADQPLRLHAERRGDRELPPRPRRHLVRPRQLRVAAPEARDQGRERAGREQPRAGVRGDPPARPPHGSQPRRERPSCARCGRTSRRSWRASRSRAATCASTTSSTRRTTRRRRTTFIGSIYKLFGFRDIADAAGGTRRRLPAALGRVHRREEPADHRPRRHEVLPAGLLRRLPRVRAGARSRPSSTTASSRPTTTSPRAGGRGSCSSRGRWRASRSGADGRDGRNG